MNRLGLRNEQSDFEGTVVQQKNDDIIEYS